jgi:uncharacterized protein YciI
VQFIYRIQPVRWDHLSGGATPEEEVIVGRHFDYLKGLTERGVVLLAGRTLITDSASFGVIIFEAADEAAARRIVDEDPAVAARVFRAELFPFRIALQREE